MPAPFVPAAGMASIAMRFTQHGQQVENVYHATGNFPPLPAQMQLCAQDFKNWWVANIAPICSSGLALNSIVVTDMTTQTSPGIEYVTGLPAFGGLGGADAPMNVSLAIKWLTDFRGRSFRGRTFHLGLQLSQIIDDTVKPATIVSLQAGYALLIPQLALSVMTLVVASKFSNKNPRALYVGTRVTRCVIDPIVDSQRRRLPGRGR